MSKQKTKPETVEEFDIRNRLQLKYSWRQIHELLMALTDHLGSESDIRYYHGHSPEECREIYAKLTELREMR